MWMFLLVVLVALYFIRNLMFAWDALNEEINDNASTGQKNRPLRLAAGFLVIALFGLAIFAWGYVDEWVFGPSRRRKDLDRRNGLRRAAGHPPRPK